MPGQTTPSEKPPSTAAPSTSDTGNDALIPRWVKVAAAIVGVVASICGIGGGLYQLVQQQHDFQISLQKEETEEKKAEMGKAEAESNTAKAAEAQTIEQLKIAQLSYQQQLNLEKLREQQTSDDRLADTISRMFAADRAAEGDLAELSEYISNGHPKQQDAILDAIAAKLAAPRSIGEVHIAFRLIDGLGPSARDLVIQSNRIARQRFDQLMEGHLWLEAKARLPIPAETASSAVEAVDEVEDQVINALDMSPFIQDKYQAALLNDELHRGLQGLAIEGQRDSNSEQFENRLAAYVDRRIASLQPSDDKNWRSDARIQAAVLSDSVAALEGLVVKDGSEVQAEPLDLSDCYLAGMEWPGDGVNSVVFDQAYVGRADFSTARFDAETLTSLRENAIGAMRLRSVVANFALYLSAVPAIDDTTIRLPILNRGTIQRIRD